MVIYVKKQLVIYLDNKNKESGSVIYRHTALVVYFTKREKERKKAPF